MSIPDNLIIQYFKVYTYLPNAYIASLEQEILGGKNPFYIKMELAKQLVERYHASPAADTEHEWFIERFSKKQAPVDTPIIKYHAGEAAYNIVKRLNGDMSNSNILRLFKQGAVTIADDKISSDLAIGKSNDDKLIKIGKRQLFQLKLAE